MSPRPLQATLAVLALLGTPFVGQNGAPDAPFWPTERHLHGAARQKTDDPRVAGIQAMLDRRVAALEAGDRRAWLATVWAGAPAAFRDAQGRLFDGLRTAPLSRYRLEVDDEVLFDLGHVARGRHPDRYGDRPVVLVPVRQRLRVEGVDDRDDAGTLWLTLVDDGGTWVIAADDDLADLGLDTERGIWDGGPVEVARRDAAVVLHHPDMRPKVDELLDVTNQAVAELRDRWPGEWPGKVVVVLPSTQDELRRIMQTTLDLDKFVAFVTYEIDRDDGWEPTAPRVLVQDRNLSRYSRGGKVETLLHELVHAAGAPLSGPFQPTWVHEGLAEWIAKGAKPEHTKLTGGLPDDHEFVSGSQSAILGTYGRSTTVMARLAAEWGDDAPFRLFRDLGARRVAPGDTDHHVDEVLRALTGLDAAALTEQLKR